MKKCANPACKKQHSNIAYCSNECRLKFKKPVRFFPKEDRYWPKFKRVQPGILNKTT